MISTRYSCGIVRFYIYVLFLVYIFIVNVVRKHVYIILIEKKGNNSQIRNMLSCTDAWIFAFSIIII